MKKYPLIGILVSKPKPAKAYEICKDVFVNLIVFNIKGIDWHNNTVFGYVYENGKWEKKASPLPSVVYNRSYKSTKEISNRLEEKIGKGKVFNCITRFDKWEIASILKDSLIGDYIPKTFLYNPLDIVDLLKKYNKLVLKPTLGYFGREVYFLEISSQHRLQLYNKVYLPQINTISQEDFLLGINNLVGDKRFVVQKFISFDRIDEKIYDIRIYVHKNGEGKWTVSGGFCRVSFDNSYLTNMSSELMTITEALAAKNGFTAKDYDKMKAVSLYAAKRIEDSIGHLGELCVDFAIGQGEPWIIEVNGKTQKHIVKGLKDKELARGIYIRPLQYARFLAIDTKKLKK